MELDWFDFSKAYPIPTSEKSKWVEEIIQELTQSEVDDFQFSHCGDTMIIGVKNEDGIEIYDVKVRRSTYISNDAKSVSSNDNCCCEPRSLMNFGCQCKK